MQVEEQGIKGCPMGMVCTLWIKGDCWCQLGCHKVEVNLSTLSCLGHCCI